MYEGEKVIVIIPARSGSKGVYKKNLVQIHGISLIARVANLCGELFWLDRAVISTDDYDMSVEGQVCGLEAPFKRPTSLSGDTVSALEVWRHAQLEAENHYGVKFGITILLEPTSPCRTSQHVKAAVDKLIEGKYHSVVTVSQTEPKYHPLKQLVVADEFLSFDQKEGQYVANRQELGKVFHRNGIAYIARRDYLLECANIIGENTGALIIDEPVVNIDSPADIDLASKYLTP